MPAVHAHDIDIEYETFGRRGDPCVVLIMGLAMQMIAWDDAFCELLVGKGLFVIRFDNRDVGRSSWLDALGMPDLGLALSGDPAGAKYSLEDMADDVAALLEALELPRAHVVGTSMGGMMAQCLAIRHPERVASVVSIMSTTGDRSVGQSRPEALAVLFAPAPPERDAAIEYGVHLWRTIGSKGFPFDEPRIRDRTARAYDRGVNPQGVARQFAAIVTARDRTEDLAKVRVPTVVIHGADDPLIDRSGGEATARAISGARLVVIPGMGHDMPIGIWPTLVESIDGNVRRAAP